MSNENEHYKFGNSIVVKLSDENETYLNEIVRNYMLKLGYTENMLKEKKKYKGLFNVLRNKELNNE